MHAHKMSKLTRWLRFLLLFPVMLFMGVEGDVLGGDGDGGGDGGDGTILGGDGGDGGGDGGQTAEQIAATEAAAATAEAARFAALTPEEQTAETAAKAAADLEKAGAPEAYTDFTMPEGVQADQALLDQFKPLAKELNLSQAQAQKLVDLQTQAVANMDKAKGEAWKEITDQWRADCLADKEVGGTNFKANVEIGNRALNTFATPELVADLKKFGFANHPGMFKMFTKIGKAMSEDKVVIPGAGVTKQSIEDSLYGTKA